MANKCITEEVAKNIVCKTRLEEGYHFLSTLEHIIRCENCFSLYLSIKEQIEGKSSKDKYFEPEGG